jgi:hypothetical protein
MGVKLVSTLRHLLSPPAQEAQQGAGQQAVPRLLLVVVVLLLLNLFLPSLSLYALSTEIKISATPAQ